MSPQTNPLKYYNNSPSPAAWRSRLVVAVIGVGLGLSSQTGLRFVGYALLVICSLQMFAGLLIIITQTGPFWMRYVYSPTSFGIAGLIGVLSLSETTAWLVDQLSILCRGHGDRWLHALAVSPT